MSNDTPPVDYAGISSGDQPEPEPQTADLAGMQITDLTETPLETVTPPLPEPEIQPEIVDPSDDMLSVKANKLRIRSTPDKDNGVRNVVGHVDKGTKLHVLDDTDPDWLEIEAPTPAGNIRGYVSKEYVTDNE